MGPVRRRYVDDKKLYHMVGGHQETIGIVFHGGHKNVLIKIPNQLENFMSFHYNIGRVKISCLYQTVTLHKHKSIKDVNVAILLVF